MWRVDNTNGWIEEQHSYPAKKKIADYFQRQLLPHHVGQLPHPALIDAMLEIGADRIMFSTDWPFENIDHAAIWFDAATHQRERPHQDRPHQCDRLFKLKMS